MRAARKKQFRLTKTAFLKFLKCAEFWLDYHEPLLAGVKETTLEHEHLRQQGYDVERLVRQLARFQDNDEYVVDYQRVFQTADLASRTDVTTADKNTGEIDIYEIKATSSIKPEHLDDVSFQTITAEKMGFNVRGVYIITMNGDYVRRGEIDVEELFTVTDVTEPIRERLPRIEERIKAAFAYLDSVPAASLQDYCIENKLDCQFLAHLGPFPDYTVFDISYLKHDKRRELLASDVLGEITEVPENFPLSPKQRSQVQVAKSGEVIIKHDKIRERMDAWEYPLHFLDYETFAYAIPQFEGIRPFQQMVFQYSLHTIDKPGAEPKVTGFLSRGNDAPPRVVAEHLRDAMTSRGIGTVFVWYEPFEKGRNEEMAEMFPDLAGFFAEVNDRTYDLMKIFADDLYIHPDFKGKTSMTKVLPVLCPHLSYATLGIGDGMTATINWYRAAKWDTLSDAERETIFNDLLEYCELDTLAMVEIYRCLVKECCK